MSRFISEDDLKNFEGWLAYQGYDPEMLDSDDLAKWRELFEQNSKRPDVASTPRLPHWLFEARRMAQRPRRK